MSSSLLLPESVNSPAIAEALNAAASQYTFNVDSLTITCPYVGVEMGIAPETDIAVPAKATPEEFQLAAGDVYKRLELGNHVFTESDVVHAISGELRGRRIGIDCSGFVTSILSRGLGSLGLQPFIDRTQYHDSENAYPIEATDFAIIGEAERVEERRQAIDEGRLSSELRADPDMQRLVDNSTSVLDGRLTIGDIVLYAPFSIETDPAQRGHVSIVTKVKGNRVTLMHSQRGKNGPEEGRVSSYSVPTARLLHPSDGKKPVSVRRMNVVQ